MEIIDWQATLWAQFAILHQLILPHFFRSATLSSSHILSTTWQGLPWTCCNTTTMAISHFFRSTQPCHYCLRPSNLHSHSLLPLWPTIQDPATLSSLQLDPATRLVRRQDHHLRVLLLVLHLAQCCQISCPLQCQGLHVTHYSLWRTIHLQYLLCIFSGWYTSFSDVV
jgi:hypothetical protein